MRNETSLYLSYKSSFIIIDYRYFGIMYLLKKEQTSYYFALLLLKNIKSIINMIVEQLCRHNNEIKHYREYRLVYIT